MRSPELPGNTKVDLFHWGKMLSKWGNSTDGDQNLISFEGGHDTSAVQILDHYAHAFSRECPETTILTCFTKSKCRQNEEN